MKRHFTLLALMLAFTTAIWAQDHRNCGTTEYMEQQMLQQPEYQRNLDAIEEHTQRFIKNHQHQHNSRTVITIPVVVHVVWNTTAENISDNQIFSQINVLNEDFRKMNADVSQVPTIFQGVVADAEIEFCLAQRDPNGNATTGITRTQTSVTSFSTNNNVKFNATGGKDAWPRDQYLNLWVCDLGNGLLGYAQFPGGSASTDGVVCDYAYFGSGGTATYPYDKGRTATHEVGHWLNLRHIWGDATCGNDQVSDTPVHNTSNGGCPAYPHYSTCSGSPIEMTMNYMDYTYDACMYMFTLGQSTRMNAVLAPGGARYSLVSSLGCTPPNPNACNTATNLLASNITNTSATVSWAPAANAISYNLDYKLATSTLWNTVNVAGTSFSITGLNPGTSYNWRVQTVCAAGSSSYSANQTFTTTQPVCNDPYETNNTRNTAKVVSTGFTLNAAISSGTDQDWFRFSNSSAARNIRVDLTNLAANYHLRLYRNSTLLAQSTNAGTADETIIFNTTTVSTAYYAQVYPASSTQFNNAVCYDLLISTSGTPFREGELETELVNQPFEFLLYPNPASQTVTLEFNKTNRTIELQVDVLDITGKQLYREAAVVDGEANQRTFDISNLPDGTYFIRATKGEEVFTQRFVVIH